MGLLLADRDRRLSAAWWPEVTMASKRRRLAVYVFVTVAFVTLAWRNEVQDDKVNALVHKQAVDDYESCLARRANVERLNTLYAGLVDIERRNPFQFTSPRTIRDRIDLFTAAQLKPPNCGERPE
jgi:hypothetical protein